METLATTESTTANLTAQVNNFSKCLDEQTFTLSSLHIEQPEEQPLKMFVITSP